MKTTLLNRSLTSAMTLLIASTMASTAVAQTTQPAASSETVSTTPADTGTSDQPAAIDTTKPDNAWRLNIYLENDSSWLKPNNATDRWYTNGTLISITHQPEFAQNLLEYLPFAESFANSYLDADNSTVNAAMGYHVGQLMFTPRHIDIKAAQHDDQPFAGYLYAGAFIQRANDVTLDHFQLDIGMVGPSSQAGAVQRLAHSNFAGGDNPRGWDNQLRDEPTIQTFLRKKWRLSLGEIAFSKDENTNALKFQIIPETGIALGTVYRHFEAGATFRAGFVLPDDFGPGYISNLGSATGNATPIGWSGYVFAGLAGKAVEHSMFLDGSDFHHNTVEVDHEPLTGQASAGIAISYRSDEKSTFNLSYSQIYSTHEFKGQSGSPAYGALRLTWVKVF